MNTTFDQYLDRDIFSVDLAYWDYGKDVHACIDISCRASGTVSAWITVTQ